MVILVESETLTDNNYFKITHRLSVKNLWISIKHMICWSPRKCRLLVGAKKHDHIKHVLRDRLHWLRVPQRIQFKLCLLTFKALHGLAPPYIADLCRPVTSVGSKQRLRSATCGDLVVSSTATHFCSRAFVVADPQLPSHLWTLESVGPFKTAIKTYLHSIQWLSQIVSHAAPIHVMSH